jgi:ribokinase
MEAIVSAMRIARESGVPVLLNPAPIAPHLPEALELPTVIVANEVEAAALVPEARGDHEREARLLSGSSGRLAVITLGEEGAVFCAEGVVGRQPAFPVTAVDSVGAGDAFCGALAVALTENMPAAEAVRFASAAGAIAVMRPGATAGLPSRSEILTLLNGR